MNGSKNTWMDALVFNLYSILISFNWFWRIFGASKLFVMVFQSFRYSASYFQLKNHYLINLAQSSNDKYGHHQSYFYFLIHFSSRTEETLPWTESLMVNSFPAEQIHCRKASFACILRIPSHDTETNNFTIFIPLKHLTWLYWAA